MEITLFSARVFVIGGSWITIWFLHFRQRKNEYEKRVVFCTFLLHFIFYQLILYLLGRGRANTRGETANNCQRGKAIQILTSHIFIIIFKNLISRFLLQYKFVSLGHHASILKARIQLQRCEYQRFFHPLSSYQACSRVSVDLCIHPFLLYVKYCWLKKPIFFPTSYHVFDLVGPIHYWMT